MLDSGSHYGPSSRMRNTSRQTNYVVLVEAWAPIVAIVAQRSTFEAMFLAPEAQPASEGPVLSLPLLITTVGLTCPLVIRPGPSPGEGPLESVLPTISLAVHHSDQLGCLVYLL